MDVEPHIRAIQDELLVLAALGDDASAEAARRLALALEATLGLHVLSVLSDAAAELTPQLPHGRAEVRLTGREPELVFVPDEQPDKASAPAATDDAGVARVTLRLPEPLKAAAETQAAREGLSLNAWLVRAIARGAARVATSGGHRMTGYGRS
jgi:hypothetical protein